MSARDRVLDAAERRLLQGGPGALVLDAVAADAGVSKGGLLYHFKSKESLVEGLCERMLQRFDEDLERRTAADPEPRGAFTRAYLATTVTADGQPADSSAQLMAGILALLGRDSEHFELVRRHFSRWHARLAEDGIDETSATLVRLAADGLWLSALLGLPRFDQKRGARTTSALRSLTEK